MNGDKCRYSYHELDIPGLTFTNHILHPAECPECGAIRKIEMQPRSFTKFMLPEHNVLIGTSRTRKRWKMTSGRWRVVE